ncbi:acyl carrier protein [Luteibacter yeojuensis]|jgi:acyl carrier protein
MDMDTLRDGIRDLIAVLVAEATSQPRKKIQCDLILSKLEVDSIAIVGIAMELEDRLGIEVDPTIAWDYPTIDRMADFLSNRLRSPGR